MKGSALGSRTIRNTWNLPAPNTVSIWIRSASAERSPSMTLTSTGKNEITAAITTLLVMPKPNQTTNSGASATFGTVWKATTYGMKVRSISRTWEIAVPQRPAPPLTPSRKP